MKPVAGVEHTYSYLAPSAVAVADGRAEVTLATSGGKSAHPFFFSGFLGAPRQTAQALLVVAEVARTRYYEPPQMVAARRFLQSLPRTKSRTVAWATPAGNGLRLSARADTAAVCLAGPERLRLLERLL